MLEYKDKERPKKCKACNGRGIVANPKGTMQVCPLCGGSGEDKHSPHNIRWR